jgi:hypothetical protein
MTQPGRSDIEQAVRQWPYAPQPNVRLAWGMVAYGPFPFAEVYASHLCAIAFASRYFAVHFINGDSLVRAVGSTDRMYTHAAESAVGREFLASDATHLFMCEMDVVLPIDTIPALLQVDKPIVSGLYFLRGGRGQPCLYVKSVTPPGNPYPHTPVSLFPTDRPFKLGKKGGCPGLGCVLIRREVFEALEEPYFDLRERNPKTGEGAGSDMWFFTKVRDAGFEVWVEPRVRCGHLDYVTVGFEDYVKRLQDDPQYAQHGYILAPDEAVHG